MRFPLLDKLNIYLAHRSELRKIKEPRRVKIQNTFPLSKEQKKAIDAYYLKHFGKTIPYNWHQNYAAFTGNFDVTYFPESLFIPEFERISNDERFYEFLQDKNNLNYIFKDNGSVRLPKTYFMSIRGILMNDNHELISIEDAYHIFKERKSIFCKPSFDTSSGHGCKLFKEGEINSLSFDDFATSISSLGSDFIAQEVLTCSSELKKINPDSVNTFRVITYILDGEVYHMPVILRIGRKDAFVDNAHAGGLFIAVDDDGQLHKTAFTEFCDKYDSHPDNGVVFETIKIPNIKDVIETAHKLALAFPQIGVINWDFTLDENNCPVLIEANTRHGSIWLPQMAHGKGCFGENTARVLNLVGGITEKEEVEETTVSKKEKKKKAIKPLVAPKAKSKHKLFEEPAFLKKMDKLSNCWKNVISCLAIAVSYLLVFVAGSVNEGVVFEQAASNIVELLKDDPNAGNCFNIAVTSNTDDIQGMTAYHRFCKSINDEYYDTNPFASVITFNADKTLSCIVPSFGTTLGSNMTFIVSPEATNHVDTKGNYVMDYLYIKMMFEKTESNFSGYTNFTFLSKSQADYILEHQTGFDGDYDYESLIGTSLEVVVGGNPFSWMIGNIYYEDWNFNQLAKASFNNYMICYQNCPDYESFRATYRDHVALVWSVRGQKNQAYLSLQRLNSNFGSSKFSVKVLTNNLKTENHAKANAIIEQLTNTRSSKVLFYLLTVLFFASAIASVYIIGRLNTWHKLSSYFLQLGSSVIVILLLEAIYLLTNSIALFSSYSLLLAFIFLVIHFIFFFIFYIPYRREKKQ